MDNDTVTPEARKAAADLLDEVSSLLGDTGIGQVADLIRDGEYDEHDATLAFARFERDILARSRSEVGCTIPTDHPLAKGLRTSQKALDEIKRQEQANIAGYLAMRDMPIGSVAADDTHQSETGAALTSDGREAALIAALSKIMPITFDNGPDYMSLYFGGETHSTQAMTMHPQDWYDLQTAYEAALAQPVDAVKVIRPNRQALKDTPDAE